MYWGIQYGVEMEHRSDAGHMSIFTYAASSGSLLVLSTETSSWCHQKYFRTRGRITSSTTLAWLSLSIQGNTGRSHKKLSYTKCFSHHHLYAPSCAVMGGLLFPQLCLALCNMANKEEIKPLTPQPFKLSTENQASLSNLYFVSLKSAKVTLDI